MAPGPYQSISHSSTPLAGRNHPSDIMAMRRASPPTPHTFLLTWASIIRSLRQDHTALMSQNAHRIILPLPIFEDICDKHHDHCSSFSSDSVIKISWPPPKKKYPKRKGLFLFTNPGSKASLPCRTLEPHVIWHQSQKQRELNAHVLTC